MSRLALSLQIPPVGQSAKDEPPQRQPLLRKISFLPSKKQILKIQSQSFQQKKSQGIVIQHKRTIRNLSYRSRRSPGLIPLQTRHSIEEQTEEIPEKLFPLNKRDINKLRSKRVVPVVFAESEVIRQAQPHQQKRLTLKSSVKQVEVAKSRKKTMQAFVRMPIKNKSKLNSIASSPELPADQATLESLLAPAEGAAISLLDTGQFLLGPAITQRKKTEAKTYYFFDE